MSFEKVQLPATISQMCCQTGKVTVLYCTEIKENGVSIMVNTESVDMVLEGLDDCLIRIAAAIARV